MLQFINEICSETDLNIDLTAEMIVTIVVVEVDRLGVPEERDKALTLLYLLRKLLLLRSRNTYLSISLVISLSECSCTIIL